MRKAKTGKPARRQSGGAAKPRVRPDQSALESALAALAHEVRTPLTGILALGELLAASDLPERERGWASAIKSAAEHLAQLTTVVVDGVKADAQGLTPRADPFRPRRLAETIAATLVARAEAKDLRADVTIGDLPDVAAGDPVRLRAALENLIDNAVKFTDQGTVTLRVAAKAARRGHVRLAFEVEDTGIGVTPAEARRLFRPFSQGRPSVARRHGGAGLGLALVKRIAQAMGGDLTLKSVPGSGSTFRFHVLVQVGPAVTQGADAQQLAPAPVGRALRILCAEDNPYGRVVLNTILTELGHRVDFVGTGEAAVEGAVRGYDAVLMDVTLPGIDGIVATARIRALDGSPSRVPIIGISGRGEAAQEAAARAAGMDDYLVKPVSPSTLAQVLAARVP